MYDSGTVEGRVPRESILRRLTTICVLLGGVVATNAGAACPELDIEIGVPVAESRAREFRSWLCDVAASLDTVYGRFPVPELRVRLVQDDGRGWNEDRAVAFGRVRRGRVPAIDLFADLDRPIEDFYADWTVTHEFSHLLLPRISDEHRWIGEGFATYYQNVLMARSGQYTKEYALQMLDEGFGRGRASRPELSPNAAARAGIRSARYKIYWSGAAIALLADVELRSRSNGQESLDTVLDRFQACCLPSQRRWSGTRLFRQLDELLDEPVFMPLYRQHADTAGFPDVAVALARDDIIDRIFAVRTSTN